jgi:hypothetical protein
MATKTLTTPTPPQQTQQDFAPIVYSHRQVELMRQIAKHYGRVADLGLMPCPGGAIWTPR